MAKKVPGEKRQIVITLDVEAAPGTPPKFFEKLAQTVKKHAYIVDDIYDADDTDMVDDGDKGLRKVKLISVKVV